MGERMNKPMLSSLPTFEVTEVGSAGSLIWSAFVDQGIAKSLPYTQSSHWTSDVRSGDVIAKAWKLAEGRCRMHNQGVSDATILIDLGGGGLAYASFTNPSVSVVTAFGIPSPEQHMTLVKEIRKAFPLATPKDDKTVRMTFWMRGQAGAAARLRTLDVPDWKEIIANYPGQEPELIGNLMQGFVPDHGGQMILWHGEPGTGKTTALRSLAYAWRQWCSVEYVVDPEAFFGSASYMMDIVMHETDQLSETYVGSNSAAIHPLAVNGKWRLLILEDAGELLAEDARQENGQALSRFLNLADGMIGQGMKILSLVTTNEPLGKLHPAVGRPGRCAAEVEFKKFTVGEAMDWLEQHGVSGGNPKPQTLAELYAQVEGFTGAKGTMTKGVGF